MGKACNFKRIVPLFLVSAFIFGFLLSLFSLLAPYMGFGEKEEFILYRIIDIRRRDVVIVGFNIALLSFVLFIINNLHNIYNYIINLRLSKSIKIYIEGKIHDRTPALLRIIIDYWPETNLTRNLISLRLPTKQEIIFISPFILVSLIMLFFLLGRYGPVNCYSLRPQHQCVCLAMEGMKAERMGYPDDALRYFTQSIEICPSADYYRFKRVEQLAGIGESQTALAELNQVMRDVSGTSELYSFFLARGKLHAELGNNEEAVSDFETAHEIQPGTLEPVQRLAEFTFDLGDYDTSVGWYDIFLGLNQDNEVALTGRGKAHHMAGRFAEAMRDYDRALLLNYTLVHVRALRDAAANGDFPVK